MVLSTRIREILLNRGQRARDKAQETAETIEIAQNVFLTSQDIYKN